MSIAADLGYHHRPPNRLQKGVQAFAGTSAGGWVFARTLRHLDNAVARVTKGRTSAPEVLAGLPVLDLTTIGRKSGQPRTSHLISIPIGDTLALLGTNFGQPKTPAWVFNLGATPACTVSHKGRVVEAIARPATAAEREEVLRNARGIYGGYLKYLERITEREVRIFLLEPPA